MTPGNPPIQVQLGKTRLMIKKHKILSKIIPLIIISVAIVGFILLKKTRPSAPVKTIEERQWLVQAETITVGTHSPVIPLYGRSDVPSVTTISAAIQAHVQQIRVKPGEFVKKNQVLLSLDKQEINIRRQQQDADNQEIDALITSEKNRYRFDIELLKQEQQLLHLANQAVARAQALQKNDLGSRAVLDEAHQAVARQQIAVQNRQFQINDHPARLAQLISRKAKIIANIALIQLDLGYTKIVAPTDARIISVHTTDGEYIGKNSQLLTLLANRQIELHAQIPSRYIPIIEQQLAQGKPLMATSADDTLMPLTLTRLAASIREGQGGVDAFFSFGKNPPNIPIGRIYELWLSLPALENSFTVPQDALYGTHRLYKIVDQRLVAIKANWLGEMRTENHSMRLILQSPEITTGDALLITKFANAMHSLHVVISDKPITEKAE